MISSLGTIHLPRLEVGLRGAIHILDRTGHSTVEWSTEDDTKLDPQYVEKEFQRLVDGGHLAFAEVETSPGKKENVQIKQFDPEQHEKVTMVPPFVGG